MDIILLFFLKKYFFAFFNSQIKIFKCFLKNFDPTSSLLFFFPSQSGTSQDWPVPDEPCLGAGPDLPRGRAMPDTIPLVSMGCAQQVRHGLATTPAIGAESHYPQCARRPALDRPCWIFEVFEVYVRRCRRSCREVEGEMSTSVKKNLHIRLINQLNLAPILDKMVHSGSIGSNAVDIIGQFYEPFQVSRFNELV